ncbi:MAG TPA: XdhC/CoxI family protein [Solirubrobacter sp.]|nr:XdhC/CoxI family protein [Solirubrobacter sp.]
MTRPVQHTAAAVAGWLREGRRVAAGLLVQVDGSSPLDVGASMYIDEQGGIEGSITGGCVEGAVAAAAIEMLEADGPPQLVTYGISDELAGTVGLMCGGIVHIFIHELKPADHAAVLRDLEATIEHRPAALVTLLDGEQAGAKLYVDAEGDIGSLRSGELLDRNARREARGLLAEGRSTLRNFGTDGASLGSGLRVYASIQAEPPRMVVFGAIDFSSALAPLAKGLGYRVTIADPRSAFLASRRFSADAETEVGWPDKVLEGVELGARDAVLIFTHDPKLDVPAVQAALGTGAGYIGALGSRNTTADRNRRLRDVGVTDEQLARVFAPCGLDIGASTVEETAVAVLAEIIAHRAGRAGQPLREASGPIRHADTSGASSPRSSDHKESVWPIPSP